MTKHPNRVGRAIAFATLILISWPNVALAQSEATLGTCNGPQPSFSSSASLETWLWQTRIPTEASPVVVHVCPGSFGAISCPAGSGGSTNGFTTFKGKGPDISRIEGTTSTPAVTSNGCEELNFEDLSLFSDGIAVVWNDGGSSNWRDTELWSGGSDSVADASAWLDGTCSASGLHYFFSSRIVSRGGTVSRAIDASCSEIWFFGGELMTRPVFPSGTVSSQFTIESTGAADVRVFGSAIRSTTGLATAATFNQGVGGANVASGGELHIHGGIVNVGAPLHTGDVDAIGLAVDATSTLAHTPGTAFVIKPAGTGAAVRVTGPSAIAQSPFLWQSSSDPPGGVGPLTSSDGQDLFVEVDCTASGDCSPSSGGQETHLMIYNAALCGAGDPWYDLVTRACRSVGTP